MRHVLIMSGTRIVPDVSGGLYLPDHDMVVVADLHLEKGSSLASRGRGHVPPYDTDQTLHALARVLERLSPSRVVALGDSFHDPRGPSRLSGAHARALASMVEGRSWTWVTGNHDPVVEGVGGEVVERLVVDDLTFVHEPSAPYAGHEVAGHLHPVAVVDTGPSRVRARCFAFDGRRCVLPAFGAYAGGLDVTDRAFAPLFAEGMTAYVVGRDRVYAALRLPAAPAPTDRKGSGNHRPRKTASGRNIAQMRGSAVPSSETPQG